MNKNADSPWASGREKILELLSQYTNITTWQTIRTWKCNYGLPIRYFPNGTPFIIENEFKSWAINFDKIKKQKNT
mgnify:FL=1